MPHQKNPMSRKGSGSKVGFSWVEAPSLFVYVSAPTYLSLLNDVDWDIFSSASEFSKSSTPPISLYHLTHSDHPTNCRDKPEANPKIKFNKR